MLSPHDAASDGDRAFFEANPRRSHRVRYALPGEAALVPGLIAFVTVRQLAPGARVRLPLHAGPPPAPLDQMPESAARAIFAARASELGLTDFVRRAQRALADA